MGSLTAALAAPIRDKCAAWAHHNVKTLADARPELPEHLRNRSAEVWWPLLAIADLVGGDWPKRAREASKLLGAGGDRYDEKPDLVLLLSDIKTAFADAEIIATAVLLTKLNAIDESPWGARRRGEGIDARGLARMLRPLGIRPRTVGSGKESAKGYRHEQFEDAFARYLNYPSRSRDDG